MSDVTSIDFTRVFDIPEYQRRKYPQKKAVLAKRNGVWEALSIEDVQRKANTVSAWLLENGYTKGDRLVIVPGMGSPDWMVIDFACQQVGIVVVPLHPTSSLSESEFILKETQARACITADTARYDKLLPLRETVRTLQAVYHLEEGKPGEFPPIHGSHPATLAPEALEHARNQVTPGDILTILYTSGTTGTPKGVVLTHANVVSNIKSILTLLPLLPGHRVLSFLPFSHIFERTSCYGYMAFGVSIHFSQSLDGLRQDFKSVRPFFCTCVPRTLEKMYDILQELRQGKNVFVRNLIRWAMKIGERYKDEKHGGIVYSIQLLFARLLVFNSWPRALGGEIKYMAVGAAALRPEIARLFAAAGILPLSGYGMTEASPFISVNRYLPGLNRFGTVGIPVPGVEIKIDEANEQGEGEILVKGPNIMQGYYQRPELNAQIFTADGWFRTGDVGKMVAKRFLAITDRKKDIFKTSSGKYVAPQPLQNHLATSAFIEQSLILGFNKPFVSAIVVPHFQILKSWCIEQGIHWTSPPFMIHNIKVVKKFQDEVDRLNETLESHERVQKFILSEEEWTVENKDLTTSFKPMRNKLLEKHAAQIEKLYLS
ncbi:MAG: long-chain fatty acid--CoA ligase [Cytophagales bacterium]|nr:long-chain fatty acid--CoA ligase [Cytophagales bacterium]